MPGIDPARLSSTVDSIITPVDLQEIVVNVVQGLGQSLEVDQCVLQLNPSVTGVKRSPVEWSVFEYDAERDRQSIRVSGFLNTLMQQRSDILVCDRAEIEPALREIEAEVKSLSLFSLMVVPLRYQNLYVGCLWVAQVSRTRRWTNDEVEFARRIGDVSGISLYRASLADQVPSEQREHDEPEPESVIDKAVEPDPVSEQSFQTSEERYRRLVEHSDAIIFHTDPVFRLNFVSSRALDFFGIAPEDLVDDRPVLWFDLLHPEDRERVKAVAEEMRNADSSFDEEFRVINRVTGRVRWLLTRIVPIRNAAGEVLGWDGFGIDISSRREAQEALDIQSKKVRALYTVSSAIRGYLDPANIASRGLATLCDATGAEAGLCYLYRPSGSRTLSLVAHHGFSADFSEKIDEMAQLPSLSNYVAEHSQSVVVPDLRNDPRASRVLAEEEGLRSAVIVPICVEDQTLGALALFSTDVSRFHGGDVMLVGAAANQIGLAARQANLFAAHRKQTKNLAALYRISHELSQNASLDDIFQQAFTIIRDELGLKRLWLGLLNETGTRIIGQAAFGPGWKRRLVEINVEVSGREHPIARVVQEREPVVIDNPSEVLREFGVKRIFSRLEIHSVALVPLKASGQVLGVLAVQPSSADPSLAEEDLTLLLSLANEIAAIVLAKRLESRIAEGEKMRTAGLLAAGIAHNFNNLLQAILGQASLLEMQASQKEKVIHASQVINEAATKGAGLVKQLLSFAQLEEPNKEIIDANSLVERGIDTWFRLIDDKHQLRLNLAEELPRAVFDSGQFNRIVTALIKNASEAMEQSGTVEVYTDCNRNR